jgi:hypothetical protein
MAGWEARSRDPWAVQFVVGGERRRRVGLRGSEGSERRRINAKTLRARSGAEKRE